MDDDLALATLFASRALHDLAGPIGSGFNAAELADEAGGDAALLEQAVKLAGDAAKRGRDRLEILRAALGRPGDGLEALDAVRGPVEAAARNAGASFVWEAPDDPASPAVRALLAACVLVALETAPRAKELHVRVSSEDDVFKGDVTAVGGPIRAREQTVAAMTPDGRLAAADPRGAFGAAARRWAESADGSVILKPQAEPAMAVVSWTVRRPDEE